VHPNLENLVHKTGQLLVEPTDPEEIRLLLAKADERIADATKRVVSNDSTFDIAYEGVLQMALIALRAHGLRVRTKDGHHAIAIQTLNTTIGLASGDVTLLDAYRRNRARNLYGTRQPSDAEVTGLIESALKLRQALQAWFETNRPDLIETPAPAPSGSGGEKPRR
jgi:hypothetical protein